MKKNLIVILILFCLLSFSFVVDGKEIMNSLFDIVTDNYGNKEVAEISLSDLDDIGTESRLVPYSKCSYDTEASPRNERLVLKEVAWMGDEASHANEWITLKKITPGDLNVSGWQILNENERISVILPQGTILTDEDDTFILARNDRIKGVEENLLFSGAIRNSNEGIRLFDNNCDLEDEVLAFPNWPGGDNESKQPMVRTEDLSWKTKGGTTSSPLVLGVDDVDPSLSCVDIASSNAEELTRLSGVGEVIAGRIQEFRKENDIKSVHDLIDISGIGELTLEEVINQGIVCEEFIVEKIEIDERVEKEESDPQNDKEEMDETISENGEECVDINESSKVDLTRLMGVGDVTAKRIIDFRNETAFTSVDDLEHVSGIGPTTVSNIKDQGIVCEKYDTVSTLVVLEVDNVISSNNSTTLPSQDDKEDDLECVNLDLSFWDDLQRLDGVGPKTAESIVIHRASSSIEHIDDLLSVSGIGESTLMDIKDQGIVCEEYLGSSTEGESSEDEEFNENDVHNEDDQEQKESILEINYPEEVVLGEEFEVELKIQGLDDGEHYDVKIILHKESSTASLSRICTFLDDDDCVDWQSSFNYINDHFDNGEFEDVFVLKMNDDIDEVVDDVRISVLIRESGGGVVLEYSNDIMLVKNDAVDQDNGYENDEEVEDPEIETMEASNVGTDFATLNGSLLSTGGHDDLRIFFEYEGLDEEDISMTEKVAISGSNSFNIEIFDLDPKRYYEFTALVEWNYDDITRSLKGETLEFQTECVDINSSSKEDLMLLHNVGESRADNIIEERDEESFSSIEDLQRVDGIGESTINKIIDDDFVCEIQ